jgi:HEAT repeat protein
MSRGVQYIVVTVFALCAASVALAQDAHGVTPTADKKMTNAEKNYIRNLSSFNEGVRINSAEYLGRYQMKGSVGALVTMLKTDSSEKARNAAAFALILLNEEEGVQAVMDASLSDESKEVASFCAEILAFQNVLSYTTFSK